jgi:tRNA-dihydrouridine synthase B
MSFWQEKIKIGNREFSRFIGGPLDGITDSPFRQLVREFSPHELMYTEMRHVANVAHDKRGDTVRFGQQERPLTYQFSANSTQYIERACQRVIAQGVDCIDLNIGCPARNVVGSGSGSALMADPVRLKEIVTHFRAKVSIPFTVKIRAGFKECNAVAIAQLLADCGVDAIAIHPRLQTQKFEGRPDYALAAAVKKAVSIPVIISGGVINFKTAQIVHEQTGVDGFLIGRGIWSKPWKLYELQEHAAGRGYHVDTRMIIMYALKHLDAMLHYYGARGLYMFRKHLPLYVRGIPGAAAVRQKLVLADSADQIRSELMHFVGECGA